MLEKRRERMDLIMMFESVRELENMDRENLLTRDDRTMMDHEYKLNKTRCLNNVNNVK